MKKILIIAALALMAPVAQANASGLDFNIGINLGAPVVAVPHVYTPAPRYVPPPVKVYPVREVRYRDDGHGRHYGYEARQIHRNPGYDRYRVARVENSGWGRDYNGRHR